MFSLCPELPALSEESLHGLCLSLNSPVVHSDDLPLGPTRAAIALHQGADELRLTVALRSLDAATVALFEFDGALLASDGIRHNIGIALSFGESLGFLFDEDLLPFSESGAEALNQWFELVGESPPEASSAAESELLLDEELERTAEPPAAPRPLLSRFRRALDLSLRVGVGAVSANASESPEPEDKGVEAPATIAAERKPAFLNRLLACFGAL